MNRLVPQAEIATILGLTTRQIRNLEAEGMPHEAEGRSKLYPIPEAVQWYVSRQQEQVAPTNFEDARARKMAAEAETAELQLGVMRGRLIEVEDAVKERARDYDQIRAKLLSSPAKYAPTTVGLRTIAESQIRWESAVHEIMAALSDTDDEFDEDVAA